MTEINQLKKLPRRQHLDHLFDHPFAPLVPPRSSVNSCPLTMMMMTMMMKMKMTMMMMMMTKTMTSFYSQICGQRQMMGETLLEQSNSVSMKSCKMALDKG